MLHPAIVIRWIDDHKGYGLFARAKIPKGTITYVNDALEIRFDKENPLCHDELYGPILDRYCYLDASGNHIMSWDGAKYMNHCCHANTLTTGYGFEIAVEDIEVGDEVTDDYEIFCVEHRMSLVCDKADLCNGAAIGGGFDRRIDEWDRKVLSAMDCIRDYEQPLMRFLDQETLVAVEQFLKDRLSYVSVAVQKPIAECRLSG